MEIDDSIMKKIWDHWTDEWHHTKGEFSEVWFGYAALSDELNIDVKTLKKFMRFLRNKKIAYHSPCINSDYMPCGSGNFVRGRFIEKEWSDIKEIIENE